MLLVILLTITSVLVILPVGMFLGNVSQFRTATSEKPSPVAVGSNVEGISVCIPARNESKSIGSAIEHLLASTHPNIEILVMDDHSEDDTAQIVQHFQKSDPRVQLHQSAPLPAGWNGKQHACWQLSQISHRPWLLFLDADVRLTPDAIDRCAMQQKISSAPLVSGFPKQETRTFAEKLLIPMMHYILLCYLPFARMRGSTDPGFAAGCGQLFFANREIYQQTGGHREIRSSRHDGIQLPRIFRKHGFKTDLFDATDIAVCRMYGSLGEVQRGLLKNANEGIANGKLIFPFTILLFGGTWLPILVLSWGVWHGWAIPWLIVFAFLAFLSWIPRGIAVKRFQQSIWGAILHPLAIAWFLCLQWVAFFQAIRGKKVAWRGRF